VTPPALLVEGVSFAYPGGVEALRDVSLRVEPGELLAVIGPNGGGKTTLLKLITGALTPSRGSVRVFGLPPSRAVREGLVGVVPQRSGAELTFPVSVRQAVAMARTVGAPRLGVLPADARDAVDEALRLTGADALADRPVGALSGGQLQRVFIARALARRPRLLILDEPTVGIDAPGQRRFAELLARLRAELGLTIVLVSHDLRTIAGGASAMQRDEADGHASGRAADRVACLRTTVHFHDAAEGITPAVLAEVFEHDLADVFGPVHVHTHDSAAAARACPDHPSPSEQLSSGTAKPSRSEPPA
jgi:zinc transport system ATP-binding protein